MVREKSPSSDGDDRPPRDGLLDGGQPGLYTRRWPGSGKWGRERFHHGDTEDTEKTPLTDRRLRAIPLGSAVLRDPRPAFAAGAAASAESAASVGRIAVAGARVNISVVIPAFNEAKVLPATLARLDDFLEGSGTGPREVLIVDDGSTDGTAEAVKSLGRPEVTVLRHPRNSGKGAAVRTGVLESRGDVVIVTDADGDYLHNRAAPFLEAIRAGADVVLASRAHPQSTWKVLPAASRHVRRRRVMGRLFNGLVRLLVGLRVGDTQTGLKFFRAEAARALFRDLRLTGFAYDVEILCRARRRGLRTRELPLVYCCPSPESKVTRLDPVRMTLDLFRVRHLCRRDRTSDFDELSRVASSVEPRARVRTIDRAP